MEPVIRYTRASDGVSIAYWTYGEGRPPLVHLGWGEISHCLNEWQNPLFRPWFEKLATLRQVVRYDLRGAGLSDRTVRDFSVDGFVRDLEAVVDDVRLGRFAMFAPYGGGLTAAMYAARHPERVSHLVLWCAYTRREDYQNTPGAQAEKALAGKDWHIYSETVSRLVTGWGEGELAKVAARFIREAVDESVLPEIFHAFDVDASDALSRLQCPVLVMHRRGYRFPGMEASQHIASQVRGAQLPLFEGAIGTPFPDQTDAVVKAIDDFIGASDEAGEGTGLTPRECDVLRLVAAGRSNREISEELSISINTVDRHVSNILVKTGASNRAQAASFAVRHNLA